jgi:hypothetical protein
MFSGIMGKEKSQRLKIIAPVGELPSRDEVLKKRMDALPKGAPFSEVCRLIDEREKENLAAFMRMEKTKKSGIIDGECCARVLRGENSRT